MHTIWIIFQREYLVRVRKRTFIVMTLLGPLLFAGLTIVPVWVTTNFQKTKTIQLIDESGYFANRLPDGNQYKFKSVEGKTFEQAKAALTKSDFDALLYIPKINIDRPEGIALVSHKNISLDFELDIEKLLRNTVRDVKLMQAGIQKDVLDNANIQVGVSTVSLSEKGEKSSSSAATFGISFLSSFIIYMAIFLYGAQVMRGVAEEKANRIVEVMISSVKPFHLMMGKILGIAAIGITQFLLWIVLTFGITSGVYSYFKLDRFQGAQLEETMKRLPEERRIKDVQQSREVGQIVTALSSLNYVYIISVFLFYFLGGYLLYSAMFAAVASAVDTESETQQFVLPISLPLIFAFIFAQVVAREPDGVPAFWLSMIPFTSPIIMVIRAPFGVAFWELALSMLLLIVTFVSITWLAGRIYRVGILMYGKKPSVKELFRWMFSKY